MMGVSGRRRGVGRGTDDDDALLRAFVGAECRDERKKSKSKSKRKDFWERE